MSSNIIRTAAKDSLVELAKNVSLLQPFSEGSLILNEQHFYQNSTVDAWTKKPVHPVTLRHLANFGRRMTTDKLLASANFVRTELPTRLSLKIKELQSLPFQITSNYHINQVYQSYYHCFNAFRKVDKIQTLEDNEKFCEFVHNMLDDHLIVLPHLMMGALEISILQTMNQTDLDNFMSSMLRSRISRRVIMDQHISMSEAYMELSKSFKNGLSRQMDNDIKPVDYIGEAFHYCSAHTHLKTSYDLIIIFLQSLYPKVKMPELIIKGDDFKFQFMANHLNYIFTEILRNSLKSTIEQFIKLNKNNPNLYDRKPPPVIVVVTNSKFEMTFKFSDQGGGIPLEKNENIWSFGKSPENAKKNLENFHILPGLDLSKRLPIVENQYFQKNTEHKLNTPDKLTGVLNNLGQMEMSGEQNERSMLRSLASRPFEYTLGVSLPMCKVYTDYWNGSIEMCSVEGYGSDVFLKLEKLGNNEAVPQLDKA
jgi:hypothetical protein